jgi:hypothetical protein
MQDLNILNVFLGAEALFGSLLEMQILGPLLLNQNPHFRKIPSDSYVH